MEKINADMDEFYADFRTVEKVKKKCTLYLFGFFSKIILSGSY
jgi:hypothetical protein